MRAVTAVLSWFVATAAISSGLAHAQTGSPERQYASGGLKVEVNRATQPGKGEFGMSLVVTNTQDAPMELFTARGIQALADTGTTFSDPKVGGLPVCTSGTAEACNENIQRGRLTPLSVDPGQSVTITLAFGNRLSRRAVGPEPCGLDLSMPVYARTLAGRTPGPWKLLTVGLPNIKVC